MNTASVIWYRPGLSFVNAPLPIRTISGRKAALIRYGGGRQKKEYNKRRAVWRRSAKNLTKRRLGYARPEVFGFDEVGLGAITVNRESTTARNAWGALTGLFSKVGDIVIQKEERKTLEARSRLEAIRAQASQSFQQVGRGVLDNPMLLLASGGALLVTAMYLKRKKARRR